VEGIGFFIVFAIIIAVAIYYNHKRAEQRKKELSAWASTNNLSFDPDRRYGLDDEFNEFGVLRKGSDRYGYNFLEGTLREYGFLGFDYHYETHSTDSKGRRQTHHHRFSAVILESKIPLKPLIIRPEGVFDKLKDFFGYNDIDFESAEFSKEFHVSAKDERWAYDVLHARAIEFLMAQTRYTIVFDRHHIIAYRGSRFFSSEDFADSANVVIGLLERLPEYVIQQQKI
jgi:hypothetical protein